MNICMLSYHTSPTTALGGKHSGGMNVYVREISVHLERLGHRVDIFTRGTQFIRQTLEGGAQLISLPAGPQREVEKSALSAHIPEFVDGILKYSIAQDPKYDIIHAHYWMSGVVGARLKAAWLTPLVLMFHTLGLVKNRITMLGERESDERIRGERRALAAADHIVAATPAEQADLQWLYEVPTHKIGVIPPGVDLEHFRPMAKAEARAALGYPQDESLVLFVGRIEALKGIDTLIRATHVLLGESAWRGKKLRVLIIGGGVDEDLESLSSDLARLRRLAGELGVQDRVEFLGSRRQVELPVYYGAADLVVMPSYSESFGMVALEAMACGRPVVASRVGGLAYLVQDGVTGFHVPEGDAEELAARLAELLADERLLAGMGAAARQEAEGYSWERTAKEIEKLFLALMKTPPKSPHLP